MKQLFAITHKKPATFSLTSPEAQKALIHANFRCQICYSSKSLKPHSRLGADLTTSPGDVLILCDVCYELARTRLRKRMYRKYAHMLHLACLITLSLGLAFLFEMFAAPLSQPEQWLYTFSLYAVALLIILFNRWL